MNEHGFFSSFLFFVFFAHISNINIKMNACLFSPTSLGFRTLQPHKLFVWDVLLRRKSLYYNVLPALNHDYGFHHFWSVFVDDMQCQTSAGDKIYQGHIYPLSLLGGHSRILERRIFFIATVIISNALGSHLNVHLEMNLFIFPYFRQI